MINSIRLRVSTYPGPPHIVLLDWSLIELILSAEACAGYSLPHNRDRFCVQIKCLFYKVLAWRMAAEGEQALARYFFERYRDGLQSAFTARERLLYDEARYPRWKIALVTEFVLEHEFMHSLFFEDELSQSEAVDANASRTCARLDKARPFDADNFVAPLFGECDAANWDEFLQFLAQDDPGFKEEILADQFAFDQVVRRRRFRSPAWIGRLIGCIFGVSSLIEELSGHARPSTLCPWHRTGLVDPERSDEALERLGRTSDRWRFRATESLWAHFIRRGEEATSRRSVRGLVDLVSHEGRSLRRLVPLLRELERTVRQFDGALAFSVESPAIQPYGDPAILDLVRRDAPSEQWVALRAELASL